MTEFAQTKILHRILLRIWLLRRYLPDALNSVTIEQTPEVV